MDELGLEIRGAVALLRLNRPSVRNALGRTVVGALIDTLSKLDDREGVRAVVLTGAAPGFCSGSDLSELAGLDDDGIVAHEVRTARIGRRIRQCRLPVIAAVEGFAIGGGFFLAAGCDVVVSAEDARWRLPEVGLGWIPPWGLAGLIARVGLPAARQLVWGALHPAVAQLHSMGVIDHVTAPGDALALATKIAQALAALPPLAVASTKRVLSRAEHEAAEHLDRAATSAFASDVRSDAARSSLARFHRPRPPLMPGSDRG